MLSIRVWYIYHYPEDYLSDWADKLFPGVRVALNRLSEYTGIEWPLWHGKSFQTTQPIGKGKSISVDVDMVWAAVRELARSDPDFGWQYRSVDLPIFIFANTSGAFCVDYYSPIYGSDSMLTLEALGQMTLLEHEIGHVFGLPDHIKPFTNPEYNNCIMGNLYLGKVQFCSECQLRLVEANYKKTPYETVLGYETKSVSLGWGKAYAEWYGSNGPQEIAPTVVSVVWPSNTPIQTIWQVMITGNTVVAISIELLGAISSPKAIAPGETIAEIVLQIPPLRAGIYETDFVVRVDGAVFGQEEVSVGVVSLGTVLETIPTTERIHETAIIHVQSMGPGVGIDISLMTGLISLVLLGSLGMMMKATIEKR